ncbi:type II secretion system F family protein [Roseomonas sp. BN140053]|uniref:type II secretion system F family protein n=1 Tax=Roseomonas sp. BN140053 TaxID=3391898 RepID=UPI0039EA6ADA
MTRAVALPLLLGVLVLAALAIAVLLPRLKREARMAERLRALNREQAPSQRSHEAVARLLRGIGQGILATGLLRGKTLQELRQTVAAAGFRGTAAVAVFVGAKAVLFLGLPLAALLLTEGSGGFNRLLVVLGAAVAGLLAPDYALRNMRGRHRAAVEKGLPDALDLMVICAEAGLPLEAAVDRVSAEMAESSPAVSAEFSTTATELRILSDRRTALLNMGDRTGLEPLRRLGGTLAQTLQYGTPLTQALRVLASELRHETLMRFEARAARLPALLTLPTILFILPCIFLVVGGPALLQVMDLLRGP